MQLGWRYAAIFDRNGVPVWWYRASGEPDNFQVLPDGTVAFDPVDEASFQTGDYEIRTLKGRLIRVVRGAGGATADIHEIQLLPNGNYLIGAQVEYQADTTAFGGSADSTVIGIEIQELTPDGDLVWHWDSRDHIGLEETGRWWDNPILDNEPYDVVHWNSAELVGKHRCCSRSGTSTRSTRSTAAAATSSGSSAAPRRRRASTSATTRMATTRSAASTMPASLPDGTITVHDNRTGLGEPPRAVRYRIEPRPGTARLVQSITDPGCPDSFCCGSARRLDGGDWLIAWGGDGRVRAYDRGGSRLFQLRVGGMGFSYRAIPVPASITASKLRAGMDTMADRR